MERAALVGSDFHLVPSSGRTSHVSNLVNVFSDEGDRRITHRKVCPGRMHAAKCNCPVPFYRLRLVVIVDVSKPKVRVVLEINWMGRRGKRLEGKILIDTPMTYNFTNGKGLGGTVGDILKPRRPPVARDNAARRNMIISKIDPVRRTGALAPDTFQ